MTRHLRPLFILISLVLAATQGYSSLYGPWFRYDCDRLGVQIPVASGWRVTEVPNGIVFAMQSQPDPYVRVAVGRVPLGNDSLERMVNASARRSGEKSRSILQIDGSEAIRVEGTDADGSFMDVFVRKGEYCYWIGFAADSREQWPQYAKTFDIVLDGFHFL
jgi:hypothetical protein